jgi:hypothetical protein
MATAHALAGRQNRTEKKNGGKEAGRNNFLSSACSLPEKTDDERHHQADYQQTSLLNDRFTSF